MLRHVLPLLLCLILMVSCQTGGRVSYDDRELEEALDVLAGDMLDAIPEEAALPPEAFETALPGNYTVYREYVPFYDMFTMFYLEDLSSLLSPLMKEAVPLLRDVSAQAVRNLPGNAFIADSGFTEELRGLCRLDVIDHYVSLLGEMQDELMDAYASPEREFLLVRASYGNLSRVGAGFELPYPEPCGIEGLAAVLADCLFGILAETEGELKNRPPESADSPYMVFWDYA